MRVLVLRPQEAAARTQERLALLGHQVVAAPIMTYACTGAPRPAGAFDAMLATSAQAFAAFQADENMRSLPLYVVGARTAQAAREAGLREPVSVASDAKELAYVIATSLSPSAKLLYPAGRDRKSDLEKTLGAKGFSIAPWVVYEAHAAPALPDDVAHALSAGKLDAALHYSRRSAEIFCALIARANLGEPARRLRHVAISADCAQGLSGLNADHIFVAAKPDESAMAALLVSPRP